MKTCAIAIFVKTPTLSPVKTRLAQSIGQEDAETFFTLSTEMILETVTQLASTNPTITPFWAVSEKEAQTNNLWSSLPTIWQGTGTLGQRLDSVYSELKKDFDSVILIGADSPQIPQETFKQAIDYLVLKSAARFAIGPALDGGFYLFGSNTTLQTSFWTEARYSTRHAKEDILHNASAIGEVLPLKKELDVDTLEDLKDLAVAIREEHLSSPLGDWMKSRPYL